MKQMRNARGWTVQSSELHRIMGWKSSRVPVGGLSPLWVPELGSWLMVNPQLPASERHTRAAHRVMVKCEKCDRWVPFGRFHQHEKRRDHASE
jgi:hypothetical protein